MNIRGGGALTSICDRDNPQVWGGWKRKTASQAWQGRPGPKKSFPLQGFKWSRNQKLYEAGGQRALKVTRGEYEGRWRVENKNYF